MRSSDRTGTSVTTETESTPECEDGEFLVGTETPGALVTIEQYAESVSRVIDVGSIGDVSVCRLPTDREPELLTEIPGVRYVERNGAYRAVDRVPLVSTTRTVAANARQDTWAAERIDAVDVDSPSHRDRRPRIAVLDTGIDPDHEALSIADGIALEKSSDEASIPWADDRGHGTRVAGIAAANRPDEAVPGVCPGADLYAVKVLNEDGGGSFAAIAAGIRWAVERDVDVITLGFSGSMRSRAVRDACRHALAEDTLVVAAAGNSGPLENSVGYPAAFDSVIAVTAIDEEDELASFSSRGTAVEFAAPGVDVLSTGLDGRYERCQGTSMAAPYVAGSAARVMCRGFSATATRRLLREHADEIELDRDRRGHGVVDLAATLSAVPEELTVRTEQADVDVDDGTAVLTGRVFGPGEFEEATVRFDWRPEEETAWRSTPRQRLDEPGSFDSEVRELAPDRGYQFRARAEVDGRTVTGDPTSFTTADVLTLETGVPTVLGPSAITLRGRLRECQGSEQAQVSFEYRKRGARRWYESELGTISRRRFASRLDDLEPDTTYEFRVRGRAGAAVDVGTVARASTDQRPETVVDTAVASDTSATEITIRGQVRTTDDGSDATAWFEYRARGADQWQTTDEQRVSPGEQYSEQLTGLQPRTIHEFRAVCDGPETNDVGDRYTVRTDRKDDAGALTVNTAAPSGIGPTSLTLGGTLQSDHEPEPVTMWVEYRLEGFAYWHRTGTTTVSSGDRVERRIDELAPATTYEYRVAADTGDRTTSGTVRTATTATTSSVPSRVVLNCCSPTDIDPMAITIDATVGEIVGADATDVWVEYRPADEAEWKDTVPTPLGSHERYEATIDGLEPDTTYEFRVAAETSGGRYTTDEQLATTKKAADSTTELAVTAYSPVDVGATRATLTGNVQQLERSGPVKLRLELRPAGGDDWRDVASESTGRCGLFTPTIDGLEPGGTYEYRIVAETGDRRVASAIRTLTTEADSE